MHSQRKEVMNVKIKEVSDSSDCIYSFVNSLRALFLTLLLSSSYFYYYNFITWTDRRTDMKINMSKVTWHERGRIWKS